MADKAVEREAKHDGVARQSLSELFNEHSGISVDMAIRLSKAFGSSPETRLIMQMAYDLWRAESRIDVVKVKKFKAA
ncbi:MAG: HigA family addiction module antitoxin [Gammaproteobacteria bacterium]|nr:HigA family addiction module antitoxin [Gammaproteobacteria bacterium]